MPQEAFGALKTPDHLMQWKNATRSHNMLH